MLCVEDVPFAKEVTVSCIHSPQYSATSLSHDVLLRRHFSSPRSAVLFFLTAALYSGKEFNRTVAQYAIDSLIVSHISTAF